MFGSFFVHPDIKILRVCSLLVSFWYHYCPLTLFDMGFFGNVSHGGGHHNFVVITPMIMKFGTGVKQDVFYTMVTKNL